MLGRGLVDGQNARAWVRHGGNAKSVCPVTLKKDQETHVGKKVNIQQNTVPPVYWGTLSAAEGPGGVKRAIAS